MKRIILTILLISSVSVLWSQSFENATDAVKNMGVGWNLGNTLDAHSGERMADIVKSETYWGQPVTRPELITMIKEAGFNTVRVPVTWFPHMDDNGKVDAEWMARVKEVVDYVIDNGMYCILNVHHDTGAGSTHWLHASSTVYNQYKERYEDLWKQIAEEFKNYDEHLLFEGYNEMLDKYDSWCYATFNATDHYNATDAADAYQAINNYAQSFVNVVRNTGGYNSQRNLVVNTYGACDGHGSWNTHLKEPLTEMTLPNDDASNHLIFEIHSYTSLTESNGNNRTISSIQSEIDDIINALNTNLTTKGAPVIFGEMGTTDTQTDYNERRDLLFQFVDNLITKTKANNMAVLLWMGLTSGSTRTLPAFDQPDLAQRIVNAYYGNTDGFSYPTTEDFDITYIVEYQQQWSELCLYSGLTLSPSKYKSIEVEFEEAVSSNTFKIKVYGEGTKEQYSNFISGTYASLTFNSTTLGSTISRITLQNMNASAQAKIKSINLIMSDETKVECIPSIFWGCTMTTEAQRKPTGITVPQIFNNTLTESDKTSDLYDLCGRKIPYPTQGIYIQDGRKHVVK